MKNAALVLGDQLWLGNPALAAINRASDPVFMIEAVGEATHVPSHKARTALFLSCMRHFAQTLAQAGYTVHYLRLGELPQHVDLAARAAAMVRQHKVDTLQICWPGEWRLLQDIPKALSGLAQLTWHEDTHFLCTLEEFSKWAGGPALPGKKPKQLRMEFFYRQMRRKHAVLMDSADEPLGGQWNFDAENRKAFPKAGPGTVAEHAHFEPDEVTRTVIAQVESAFPNHMGSAASFGWPVTREQALAALQRFIDARLENFGDYQDAMWTGLHFGWHSLLSTSLNMRLLDPREVIQAVEKAHAKGKLELAGVEGFIRQILGWREFIRGVYWLDMPQLATDNFFGHERELPAWYWTGKTQMNCMRESVGQTLEHGYAHHIQRLMITGNFALLAEVLPQAVCAWYLSVYVDAVDWVELPNTAGMALFANGGRFTSKPYVASGQYVKRQSNYCTSCRYDPAVRTGPNACPMTALYWRFLDKHEARFAANPRTSLMAQSVRRLSAEERQAIRDYSDQVLLNIDTL